MSREEYLSHMHTTPTCGNYNTPQVATVSHTPIKDMLKNEILSGAHHNEGNP